MSIKILRELLDSTEIEGKYKQVVLDNFENVEGYGAYVHSVYLTRYQQVFKNILYEIDKEVSYRKQFDIYEEAYLQFKTLSEPELAFIEDIGIDFSSITLLEKRIDILNGKSRKKKNDFEKPYWKSLKGLNHLEIQLLLIDFSALSLCLRQVNRKLELSLEMVNKRLKVVTDKMKRAKNKGDLLEISDALKKNQVVVSEQMREVWIGYTELDRKHSVMVK